MGKGKQEDSVLNLLRARWLADAIIVAGCSIVFLGTQLGGYKLKVNTVRELNADQSPRRIRKHTMRTILGFAFLIMPSPVLIALDLIDDGRIDFVFHNLVILH